MNFADAQKQFEWVRYSGQMDSNVTYALVLDKPVARLDGESDILYIGRTEQSIRARYEQETKTKNSPKNTQQTNIRTSFLLNKLGLSRVQCFYVKALTTDLSGVECETFLERLRTWDKKAFLDLIEQPRLPSLKVSLEKYLLVSYAALHLEVPPLNNRM